MILSTIQLQLRFMINYVSISSLSLSLSLYILSDQHLSSDDSYNTALDAFPLSLCLYFSPLLFLPSWLQWMKKHI